MRAIAGYDCHGNITNLIIWNLKEKENKKNIEAYLQTNDAILRKDLSTRYLD